MRLGLRIFLCCALAAGGAMARGGGGGGARGGGGFGGGGFRGGGGFAGGGFRGGGFVGGGFRGGGFVGGGFRGGAFGGRFGFGFRGFRGFYGGNWPGYWGWGWGYPALGFGWGGPGYDTSYYDPSYAYPSPYAGYQDPYAGYAGYQTSPNVTVIYPPNQAYVPANPGRAVIRQYDEYGQEVPPTPAAAPPSSAGQPIIFLIAFNGTSVIYAAVAYWVDGSTLHYVTLEHQERQAPLNTVNRSLTIQLNWERHVPFQLPVQ